jgi:hypothetical protein
VMLLLFFHDPVCDLDSLSDNPANGPEG